CLKATVHDKQLLLLSSSGSYRHVESLVIPHGNIIFASFQVSLSPVTNHFSSPYINNNNNNIFFNKIKSNPYSPPPSILATPIDTITNAHITDHYKIGDKRPRSPQLSYLPINNHLQQFSPQNKRYKMSSPNSNINSDNK